MIEFYLFTDTSVLDMPLQWLTYGTQLQEFSVQNIYLVYP